MNRFYFLALGEKFLIGTLCLIMFGCAATRKKDADESSTIVIHGGLTRMFEGNPEPVLLRNPDSDWFISSLKNELGKVMPVVKAPEEFGDDGKLMTNTWLSINMPSGEEDVLFFKENYVRYRGKWHAHDNTGFYKFAIEFLIERMNFQLSQASRYSPYISEARREALIRQLLEKHSGAAGKD